MQIMVKLGARSDAVWSRRNRHEVPQHQLSIRPSGPSAIPVLGIETAAPKPEPKWGGVRARKLSKTPQNPSLLGAPRNSSQLLGDSKILETPRNSSRLLESPRKSSKLFENPSRLLETPRKSSKLLETPRDSSKLLAKVLETHRGSSGTEQISQRVSYFCCF